VERRYTVTGMAGGWDSYRQSGYEQVEGWLEPETLDVLRALADRQAQIGVDGSVVEIGVHHGRLFIGLQLAVPAGTPAVAIDVFGDQQSNIDSSGQGDLRKFEANVRRWSDWSSVVVKEADSQTLKGADVVQLGGCPARLFSVDGGHTAEIVAIDLATAEEALAPGGIIVLDDVFNDEWPGVVVGTLDHLNRGSSLVPFCVGFNKTYLTTSGEHADQYRAVLRDHYARAWRVRHKTTDFNGHPVEWLARTAVTPRTILRRYPAARQAYFAVRRLGR